VDRLVSWIEIGRYLRVTARTAEIWERERGLPVHRLPGAKQKVFAFIHELDIWKYASAKRLSDVEIDSESASVESDELRSWKEISQFLGVPIRTVQFWERSKLLPVHRLPGNRRSMVLGRKDQLKKWRENLLSGASSSASATSDSLGHSSPIPRRAELGGLKKNDPIDSSSLHRDNSVKAVLFSDEPALAEGLTRIFSTDEKLTLVSTCCRVEDLAQQKKNFQLDLLLVDFTPELNFSILSNLLQTASPAKAVLWVRNISTELALQAMSLGVRGILRKTLPVETTVRCLIRVHEGELWFEKALTESIMSARRYSLTRREGQLVSLLSQGFKNKDIATILTVSEGTVKVYLSRLFGKLGVKDRFELALYGLKNLTLSADNIDVSPSVRSQLGPHWLSPARSLFVEKVTPQSKQEGQREDIHDPKDKDISPPRLDWKSNN
jgi:DNA-binding NarL/FixJ family response regulator